MSDTFVPDTALTGDVDAAVPAVEEICDRVEHAATEIHELDGLWEQEWYVDDRRAFAPQDISRASLPEHTLAAQRCRRTLDIAVALVLLVTFSSVMLLLAIAVKLTSPGSAVFKQFRAGVDGREFQMCKFRSMADGTDGALLADDDARRRYEQNGFKLEGNDPRITSLGRFMRKTSLDELPQLWNVLKGDMSIVGIRPLLSRELAMRPVHDQMLIKMMRPGMTGLWQVEGRSSVQSDDRFELDRRYVEEWSFVADVSIIARTPRAVLRLSNTQ